MKINFGKHIINVLKSHECVVLPGLGAFILKDKPAHIAENQIFVRSKRITFNQNISTNDNLLQSELMTKNGASFLEAKLEISQFVNDIKFYAKHKGLFDIEDLGRFTSQNGEIAFTAKPQANSISKNHFGLESLSLQPILREIVREEKVQREIPVKETPVLKVIKAEEPVLVQKEIATPKKRRLIPLVGLAASLVLIITISSLMFSQTTFSSLQIQNANVLNFLVPSETAVKSTDKVLNRIEAQEFNDNLESNIRLSAQETAKKQDKPEALNALANKLKNPEIEEVTVEETMEDVYADVLEVKSENPLGYYVVIGAYSTLGNANKAKYECSIENTCRVFKTDNGMYRVGIFTTTEKEIAVDIVKEYKKTNSSYWLMENK